MTATLDDVTKKSNREPTANENVAEELVARAREQGLSLTGPDGLLKELTKTVLETALNQELTEHLGHDKHGPAGNETGNVRNDTRAKTVLTEATGQVGIEVPASLTASTRFGAISSTAASALGIRAMKRWKNMCPHPGTMGRHLITCWQ